MNRILCAAVAGALGLGCAPSEPTDVEGARRAIMETDREFARATAERGVDGWVPYFESDALQFQRAGVLKGHDEIRAAMRDFLGDTAVVLTWEPTDAVVAASGELGYTVGRWKIVPRRGPAPDSASTPQGNYVSIWRRQPDGTWKMTLDIGNNDPAAPADSARGS